MNKTTLFISCMGMFFLPVTAQKGKISYPKTAKVNTEDVYFGTSVADPYRWLENDTSKATAAWVKAENAVTRAYFNKIPFRDKLLRRLTEMANFERYETPFKKNGKYYYYLNDGLQNQSVVYVQNTLDSQSKVFLDPNLLSADGTVALKNLAFSHDGRYASYDISRSGSDWIEIYVIDLATGKLLDDHIQWAKFSGAHWCGDGFYYSAYDPPVSGKEFSNINENEKIYYHRVGTPQREDKLFYQNPAYPQLFYSVTASDDETMLFLEESGAGNGNNLYVKDLRKPNDEFHLMTHDMNYIYNLTEVVDSTIYLFTNYGAPRGRMMVTDINHPDVKDWRVLVPEMENVMSRASVIGGKLFVTYMKDASDHTNVYSLDGKFLHEVHLPSLGSVVFDGQKDDPECFFSFTSFTTPGSIYKYDISQNTYQLYKAPKTAVNPADYVTEQVFFASKDGTRVPMFIIYKKGMKRDGSNPLLLYGYGGFDISLQPYFSSMRIPFLEEGGIYVMVNLRGGGEYGEKWHLAGTKLQKQNVFDDFIAAAEYLIKSRYTNKNKLAIQGGSNGGLLVGACMTQRPDLFRVAVPQVGVMDMLRYHKFTIGWNWSGDYGTSDDSAEMFRYLKGYSPLHNLRKGVSYPATLVTTGDHDDRVVPAHSFKFAATLQECNAGANPTLIRIDSKSGHGSGKPMSKVLDEQADIYAFIMYNLGMKYKE